MRSRNLLACRKGFTLTELLVVIALIVILTGFTYAGFSPLQRREQVRAAAQELAGYLREARMRAIEKHASHTFLIPAAGNQYILCREAPPPNLSCSDAEDSTMHEVNVAGAYPGVTMTTTLPPRVAGSTDSAFRFDVQGLPRANGAWGGGTVTLAGHSVTMEITISALGGVTVNER